MKRKRVGWIAGILILVLLLGGCAKSMGGSYMAKDEAYNETYAETTMATESGVAEEKTAYGSSENQAQAQAQQGAKIIYTTQMSVETEHYDEYLAGVYETLAKVGGHEQNSYIYNTYEGRRNAELTLRVPSEKRNEFIDTVSGLGNVTSISNQSRNITLQYVDTQSRIEALRTEQTRLLELLAKADNMTDILSIEERLTEVRYELQNFETVKNGYDYDVDYSTVTMSIYEVGREAVGNRQTLGGRLTNGFRNQLDRVKEWAQDVLVWLASNFIFVIIWLAVIFGAVKLILAFVHRGKGKERRARRKNKKAEPAGQIAAEEAADPGEEKLS